MGKYHLFEVFGVEMEYMIVDRKTFKAMPIADKLIQTMTGDFTSDVDRGGMAWSNELVSHVIEIKTNGPTAHIKTLAGQFHNEVAFINEKLKQFDAMLMPTGAHPFFNPEESIIWPHEYNEIYSLYDRVFGCHGHGWSNLQSTHLNLPFANDTEFAALHAAVRVLLPILPALAASTPIIEGKVTGMMDTRIEYYRNNQKRLPVIAGKIVPEAVYSEAEYQKVIFAPISQSIAPFDTERVLDKHFLNSRGAIARFDRGAIEIRVLDIQECPSADMAIIEIVIASLRWLMKRFEKQPDLRELCSLDELADLLLETSRNGLKTKVKNDAYLSCFEMNGVASAEDIWSHLFDLCSEQLSTEATTHIDFILKNGNLSERMLQWLEGDADKGVLGLCDVLTQCLVKNIQLKP